MNEMVAETETSKKKHGTATAKLMFVQHTEIQTKQLSGKSIYRESICKVIGCRDGRVDMPARIKTGFTYRVFGRLQNELNVNQNELSELVRINTRTLHRRREEGRFTAEESDRLYRVSDLYSKALELFEGDTDAAIHWIKSPKKALRKLTPFEHAETTAGYEEVVQLIGRLEHGVF